MNLEPFKQPFLDLYNQGFSDAHIAKELKICRKIIGKIRRELGLKSMKSRLKSLAPQIRYFNALGLTDVDIAKRLNISSSSANRYRNDLLLKPNFIERTYNNKTDRRKGYMLRNIKFNAKHRGKAFNLEYTDLELPAICPILEEPLVYGILPNNHGNASVDRIDNEKGYVKGNIIIMSRLANLMKNGSSIEQLEKFCENILKLTNHYKKHGALGSITDVFPDIKMYQET